MNISKNDIELSQWAGRFKAGCPTSYNEAITLANKVDFVVIEKRDDHSSKGDFLWAIIPECDQDFWLDALPTKKAALSVCREMQWCVRR
jgi:hypothetical protein